LRQSSQAFGRFERGEGFLAVAQVHVPGNLTGRVGLADERGIVQAQEVIHATQSVAGGFSAGDLALGARLSRRTGMREL